MNKKGKPLNKQCFYQNNEMFIVVSTVTTRVWMPYSPTIVLSLDYRPADDTLFKISRESCCSGVSSRYCCYGNHTAGSKPI